MDGVVLAVDRQDATPRRRAASITSAPAITSTSLFASAMVLPASIAASTASSAAVPDEAHSTMSTSGWVATATSPSRPAAGDRGVARPTPQLVRSAIERRAASPSPRRRAVARDLLGEQRDVVAGGQRRPPAAGRDARRRPPARSGRSSRSIRGWRSASSRDLQVADEDVEHGRREQQRSMRSSTPPWPGISAELSLTPALRFSSDSNRSPTMPSATTARPSDQHQHRQARHAGKTQRAADRPCRAAEHARRRSPLDGLLRADRRRQQLPAERAAGVVLRRVADDDPTPAAATRFAARATADRRQRAERQPDVERRKQRGRRRCPARRGRRPDRQPRPSVPTRSARSAATSSTARRHRTPTAAAAPPARRHRPVRVATSADRAPPASARRTRRTPARPTSSATKQRRDRRAEPDRREQDAAAGRAALRTRVTVPDARLMRDHRPAIAGCVMPP